MGNIKINFKEMGWEGVEWIFLTQVREKAAGFFENGNEPSGSLICGEFS